MATRKMTAVLLATLLFTGCMTLAQDATAEPAPSYANCWGIPDPAPSVDMTQYSTDTQLAQEANTDVPHIYAYTEEWGYTFTEACNPDFDGNTVTNPSVGVLASASAEEFIGRLKASSDDELLAIWKPWCEAGDHLPGQCDTLAAETREIGVPDNGGDALLGGDDASRPPVEATPDGDQTDVGMPEGNPFSGLINSLKHDLEHLGDSIKDAIQSAGNAAISAIKSAESDAVDGVKKVGSETIDGVKQAGTTAEGQLKDAANNLETDLKGSASDLEDGLKKSGADIAEGFKDAYKGVESELARDFENGVKAVVRYAEKHTLQEVADIAYKFSTLGADFLPDLGVQIGPVGFVVNLKDDLDNIMRYATEFSDNPPDPTDVDTYIDLLNDFAPDEVHIDVTITADALVIGIDAVDFTLSWPVKDRLPEIEKDIRALWDGIKGAEQSGEDAADAGASDLEGDVDG